MISVLSYKHMTVQRQKSSALVFCIVICLFAFGACYFFKKNFSIVQLQSHCKYSTRQSLFTYFVWLSIGWLLIDRFNRLCVVYGRKSLYFTIGDHFPKNCTFSWGIWTPSNSWLIGPDRAHNPNGITIGSAVFAQVTAECPYTLQWVPLFPKIAPSHGGSGPPSNTWFLGPVWAHNPNGISIGSAPDCKQ